MANRKVTFDIDAKSNVDPAVLKAVKSLQQLDDTSLSEIIDEATRLGDNFGNMADQASSLEKQFKSSTPQNMKFALSIQEINESFKVGNISSSEAAEKMGALRKEIDAANASTGELEKQTDQAGNAARNSGLKFTELNSAIQIGKTIWKAANDIYAAVVSTFVNYADTVRTLRDVTGESSEEMSRVIQLTGDYKISTDNLTMAQRTLAQQGKSLNIDTLASMSDEYLSLNSGVERQLYLTKNLGYEGVNYAGILNQGSAAIRDQARAINEVLIMGDAQLQQARALEIAEDNLNDSWNVFIMRVGPQVVETITAILDAQIDRMRAAELEKQLNNGVAGSSIGLQIETLAMARAEREAATATKLKNAELEKTPAVIDTAAIAIANMISITGSLQSAEDTYQKGVEDNHAELLTLMEERARLKKQGFSDESRQIQEIDTKLDANATKAEENAAAHELATNRIILAYAQQLLAADGLTQAEAEFLLQKGVDMGVYSEDAVKKMGDVITEANNLKDAINNIPDKKTINIDWSVAPTPHVQTGDQSAYLQAAGTTGFTVPPHFNHDNFMIGVKSGERVEVTPASRVSPNDKGGGGGNVTYVFNATGITDPDQFLKFVGQKVKQQGGL